MIKFQKSLVAIALALSVGSVCAQDSGSGGQGGGKTDTSGNFQTWLSTHSVQNNGRVSRQDYMAEAGRRWDMSDRNKQGLTRDEINSTYGPAAVMGGPTATNANEKKGVQK